jgi:hypothetical protein
VPSSSSRLSDTPLSFVRPAFISPKNTDFISTHETHQIQISSTSGLMIHPKDQVKRKVAVLYFNNSRLHKTSIGPCFRRLWTHFLLHNLPVCFAVSLYNPQINFYSVQWEFLKTFLVQLTGIGHCLGPNSTIPIFPFSFSH